MRRSLLAVPLALVLGLAMMAPAAALRLDHVGPGSTGPDEHSQNVKLLSNVVSSGFTNSDLAFEGNLVYAGDYGGFRVIDASDPENPQVIGNMRCNGLQGDVSVYRGLLFRSVDQPQTSTDCNSTNTSATFPGMFEGVQVFDVSDPTNPSKVTSIQTDCGSHTHTLLPDGDTVYIYVSSYPLTPANQGPDCQPLQDDGSGGHGKVSIIELDVNDPESAQVHEYFLDEDTEVAHFDLSVLGANIQSSFVACHDISVFKELDLAAGACMSESQLWDISDPLAPQLVWRFDHPVVDPGKVDLWHSATFNWDGGIVAFGDESGGGGAARCTDPDDLQGRIWFLDTESGDLLSNYKIPRSESGTCTMHNFNFIPKRDGSNVLVSSAYTGGTTVVDVDKLNAGASEAEAEVGFYKPNGGSTWSSYWYNGFIFTNDIRRGVDTMLLSDKARAGAKKLPMLNPQTQISTIG